MAKIYLMHEYWHPMGEFHDGLRYCDSHKDVYMDKFMDLVDFKDIDEMLEWILSKYAVEFRCWTCKKVLLTQTFVTDLIPIDLTQEEKVAHVVRLLSE